jgi:DNA-binding NtrC family response regulator
MSDEEGPDNAKGNIVHRPSRTLAVRSERLVLRGIRDLEEGGTRRSVNDSQVPHIIVVDDQEIREIIRSMLIFSGYNCLAVAGGLEALALLDAGERCDLLLTDLMNTPMDGLSLLIRMKEKYPEIPVVMATAIHDTSIAVRCMQEGACDYLLEPFDREQLLRVVRQALRHRNPV